MSGIWSARDPGMPSELEWTRGRAVAFMIGLVNVIVGYAAFDIAVAGALLVHAIVCNLYIWRPDAFGYPATYGEKLARPFPTFQAGTIMARWIGWAFLFLPTCVLLLRGVYLLIAR